ncbi:MAG TPA: extracellular solute-binding protein [Chloroflexota bacterium]|nr:extracellular solute-binding protein [Chloroflexota bacterium]
MVPHTRTAVLLMVCALLVQACAPAAAPAPAAPQAPTSAPPVKPTAASVPAAEKPVAAAVSGADTEAEAQKLFEAAKAAGETEINWYTSINEVEGVPLTEMFGKQYPGLTVNYFRSSETQLISRIFTEAQAGKQNFDLLVTTSAHGLVPAGLALKWNPPNAAALDPDYVDKDGYWQPVYVTWNVIEVNTQLVKKDSIKNYEDLLKPEFKDKMIIDDTDYEWLSGMIETRGREPTLDLLKKIAANGVTVINGHGNISDKIAAGEYALAVNNYLNLSERAKRQGAPNDWLAVEPVVVQLSKLAVNPKAPHPNAAKLLGNYVLSAEAQQYLATQGRFPTRADVLPDPPDLVKGLKKYAAAPLQGDKQKEMEQLFKSIFQSP